MKVLALASYPERMAATRFRMAKYVPHLAARGIHVDLVSWLDDRTAAVLYERGASARRGVAALAGLGRLARVIASRYDVVWVQREVVLIGPPVIEAALLARGVPLVLDYDDAIWIAQGGPLRRAVKCAWKADWVLSRSAHAIPGSSLLAQRASAAGVPATILPTVVGRDEWTPLPGRACGERPTERPVIGWVGTHSTASQLELVAPALRALRAEGREFDVRIVGAGRHFSLPGLEIDARPWTLDSEIDEFRAIDVGLAPMHESEWHEGKCAFKQIQYMAVGVPYVTSWVGGARDFVRDGENALVARSRDDWRRAIARLLDDRQLRADLSRAGRDLVETSLSIEAQADRLASALQRSAEGNA